MPPIPNSRPAEHRLKGIGFRVLAAIFFATMFAIGKLASQHGVVALELIFYRSLFALPVVLVWIMPGPGIAGLKTRRPGAHLLRAAIGLTGMTLTFQAVIMLPLAEATTIGFASPLFATLLSALILSERVARHRWTAIAVGFVGIVIVMQPGGHAVPVAGVAVALCGAVATAAVTITVRQLGATESPAAIVFWFMILGTIVMGMFLPFVGTAHPPAVWLLLALIGLAGGLGQLFMTVSLRLAPVSVLAPFDYVQLFAAVVFGWLFWSDAPVWSTVAGAALIAGSGLYTVYREHRLKIDRPPATPNA